MLSLESISYQRLYKDVRPTSYMMVSVIAAALILTIKLYIHSRAVILNSVTSSWKVQMVLGDNSTEGCQQCIAVTLHGATATLFTSSHSTATLFTSSHPTSSSKNISGRQSLVDIRNRLYFQRLLWLGIHIHKIKKN